MKRLLLLIIIIHTVLFAKSQITKDTIENDYYHYNKLIGQQLKFTSSTNLYKGENVIVSGNFYRSGMYQWNENYLDSILFKAKNSPFTLADSLENKSFTCISTHYEDGFIQLRLTNKTTGVFVCSFLYPNCPFSTQSQIDKIKAEEQNPCLKITKDYDEFRKFTSFSTPENIDLSKDVYITKIISSDKKISYYLDFRVNDVMPNIGKGVYIILENGKMISKPNATVESEVDKEPVDIIHPGFIHKASIQLSLSDIAIMKSSPILKYELYYLKEVIYNGPELYKMFLCLTSK